MHPDYVALWRAVLSIVPALLVAGERRETLFGLAISDMSEPTSTAADDN